MSNEQRAHDIAIKSLDFVKKSYDNTDEPFDVYKEYIKIYKMALESLNRDYPDGL